ncbi:hypothetical protein DSD19_06190 [Rhodovulum sp. BSW8]|uniref:hypothetical protein n=1 Tax=Rhodovulum sp. BSW8 TaxID=2259645 RepID=UPI000DE1CB75|nr:hypothetical protein [Rhodovulum sp. BSW8]RBO54049.1 hypothetical protein DSD19_06190 [Rhodovulum sp. BSW8]
MPVRAALEWAFGTECARFDHDEIGAVGGTGWRSYGMEYVAIQQEQLGARVDTSPGRSWPHDDAELIATVVRNTLPWYAATQVADLARAGRTPDWMPDARPRCVPVKWRETSHGPRAAQADGDTWRYRAGRGRHGAAVVEMRGACCPVTYYPTAGQIAAARRAYLDWWGWLLDLQAALRGAGLVSIEVTRAMPPMEPWKISSCHLTSPG